MGVDIPEALKEVSPKYKLFGLLGTYNNDTSDDFTGPDGVVRETPELFGDSMLVEGSCPPEKNRSRGEKCFSLGIVFEMRQRTDSFFLILLPHFFVFYTFLRNQKPSRTPEETERATRNSKGKM